MKKSNPTSISGSTPTSISQAELDVMDVLWTDNPLAASDIAARISPERNWNIRTVKTLLSRLVEKGALATTPQGRRFLYAPLITREAHEKHMTRRLSNRLFGGRAAPIVAHLADGEGLSAQDIAELEDLIQSLKDKGEA